MAVISVDSRPALAATIRLPARGAWTAWLSLDATAAPAGAVTIVCEGAPSLVGTVVRGALVGSVARVLVVGGAGGLRRTLPALSLRDGALGDVLAATLSEAGERLAATSETLADRAMARWHRHEAPAADTVGSLAASAGMAWRVLRDGSVWLGVDAFAEAAEAQRSTLDHDPASGAWSWSCDAIDAVPGELVRLSSDGDTYVRLGEVIYTLDGALLTARASEAS